MRMMLALSLLLLTACATMTHGPMETIAVDSQPRGAAASIACDGGVHVTGTTPAKLVIPRRVDGCVVEVSGNAHTKDVKAKIEKYFGPIPKGPEVKRPSIAAPKIASEQKLPNLSDKVTLSRIYFAWLTPVAVGGALAFSDADQRSLETGALAGVGLATLSFIVDAANGSMYDRDVHEVFVDLEH